MGHEITGEIEDGDIERGQEVEATNKSLSEFLAEKVEGVLTGPIDEETGQVIEQEPKLDADSNPIVEKDGKKVEEDDKKGEKQGGDEVPPKKDEQPAEIVEGQPVPYERFKEVNTERTQFKELIDTYKPKVENFDKISDFCRGNQITPEQFEKAMQVQALLNTDPEKALAQLLPIVEQLQGYVGNKLPDDLQKRVDDGKLDLADAKEIAQARAKVQMTQDSVKRQQQIQGLRQQQEFRKQVETSVNEWETRMRSTDPDYKPKAKESDPDGLWENTRDKYLAWLNMQDSKGQFVNPINTVSEMVALMEKAYKAAKQTWTIIKKPAIKPKLGANGSRNLSEGPMRIEDAKTMREAVELSVKQGSR